MKDLATHVEWGGEAFNPAGQPSPPMGSGHFLRGDTKYDAYCRKMSTLNEAHDAENVRDTEKVSIDVDYYTVEDWGTRGESGRMMTYGGHGPR